MTIEHICWSSGGSLVASVDLSRSLVVDQVVQQAEGLDTSSLFMATQPNVVQQLLFDATGTRLLVSTDSVNNIYSVEEQDIASSFSETKHRRWINHPIYDNYLFGFSHEDVTVRRWDDCRPPVLKTLGIPETDDAYFDPNSEMFKRRPSASYPVSPGEIVIVTKVLVSTDAQIALVEVSESTKQGRRRKHSIIVELSSILDPLSEEVSAYATPTTVQAMIEVSLGFLGADVDQPGSRRPSAQSGLPSPYAMNDGHVLAFIDREFWVCTTAITGSRVGRVQKRFFLPRDWVILDWLELAILMPDGKILCPRNGEVAIISNDFREEWQD